MPHMAWFENLAAIAVEQPAGVFFSNELVDAFPVRAITYRSGKWLEQSISIDVEALRWIDRPIEDAELCRAIEALSLPGHRRLYDRDQSARARAGSARWAGRWIGAMC